MKNYFIRKVFSGEINLLIIKFKIANEKRISLKILLV